MTKTTKNSETQSGAAVLSLADNALDPEKFYVPASDTKGHSNRIWVRVMPQLSHQLEVIVQSKKFPYSTQAAVVRHALYRHIKWLGSIAPIHSILSEIDAITDILKDDERAASFNDIFEKFSERITYHLSQGGELGEKEAIRIAITVQQRINAMPEGYWKSKYVERLNEKAGYLLQKAQKSSVSLTSGTDDDE